MKKLLLLYCLVTLPFISRAQTSSMGADSIQNLKRWSFSVGIGYGTTWRYEKNFLDATGVVVSFEPTYSISRHLKIGARAEYVFIKSYLTSEKPGGPRVNAKAFPSVSLVGDIKPWAGSKSPFFGLGAGLYFLGTATSATINESAQTDLETRFGVSPRVGVQLNHFSILAELHVIDEKTLFNRDYGTLKVRYTL